MEDKIIVSEIIDSIIKCVPNNKCFLCRINSPHPRIITNPYPDEDYEELKERHRLERELKECVESNLQAVISVFFRNNHYSENSHTEQSI